MSLWSWSLWNLLRIQGPSGASWLKGSSAQKMTLLWLLCDPGQVTLSDADLTWVARNVGFSNSERCSLFPSCFPLPLTLAPFLIICPSFLTSFPLLILFSFFFLVFLTWHVKTNPWERAFFFLRVRRVEGHFSVGILMFVLPSIFRVHISVFYCRCLNKVEGLIPSGIPAKYVWVAFT